ncbi:hypothetical protein AXK11_07275 [Cephaloticoccus primus]|uniref:RND efflux pump membrane fusion protein barrel-sandwich domain-containing protein n=1 Tax=Cephaloticoccus primus TaxID=1548207 RepID=A0A139SKW6_9BACT|nr:efflux RND transporter periplasmic adaptor subunit [Cephaloticoccus primus]KXU35144.1 hypothetical protein AXK11_07275 [Cephaloticoccus primus]
MKRFIRLLAHSLTLALLTSLPAALGAQALQLSREAAQNIGLQTVTAELRPLEKTISALGRVATEPENEIAITSRIPGRVTRLTVHDGQQISRGELLLEIESRLAAENPARLAFTSPIDGFVLETQVELGSAVEPADTLLTLVDLSEVDVVGEVQARDIAEVRLGQRVRIRSTAYPEEVFEGEVKTIAANVAEDTGARRVFVHTPNPLSRLLIGMRVSLAVIAGGSPAAIVVPRAAILGEHGEFFVFRQTEDPPESLSSPSGAGAAHGGGTLHFERTPVVLGLRDDRFVEIIEGVLPGDHIVTRGNYQLQFLGEGGATLLEDDHGHSHGPGGHTH